MRRSFQLLFFSLLFCPSLFATYSTDWIKQADSHLKSGSAIARDLQNNVIVTGHIQSQNMYTRKYNKFGVLLWEKSSSSGINSVYEKAVWANTDSSNNVFVSGFQYSGTSNEVKTALVVLKYNPSGVLQWKKVIPIYFLSNNTLAGFNVRSEVDNSGNIYVASSSMDRIGYFLIKIDPTGTIVFNNAQGTGGTYSLGSMRLKGNMVVVTGRSTFAVTTTAAWDTNGNALWIRNDQGYYGVDLEIDNAQNIYVLTSFINQVSATSDRDFVVYKIGPTGLLVWKKKYDFNGVDSPSRIVFSGNKLSIIGTNLLFNSTTSYYTDWITFQTNLNGALRWNQRYNGTPSNDEYPSFIAAKTTGEVFVTGFGGPTPDPSQTSAMRMVTLKYGSTGNQEWLDTLNVYSGHGVACNLATDGSLFVLSSTRMTAFHFFDHTGTGTCGVPAPGSASQITTVKARITWPSVSGAYVYHVRYKPTNATDWTTVSINTPTVIIRQLTAGTQYQFAIESVCSSGPSGYNATQTFSTTGLGYCTTSGQSTAQEYLNFVWIQGIYNFNQNNNGYADFTNLSTDLVQGASVSGFLSGLVPYPESENYAIWIDFNKDFDFDDAGEKVLDMSSSNSGWIGINFNIPSTAPLGSTRMRITMKHGTPPTPCGLYPRGETEDYTVTIVAPPSPIHRISTVQRDENPSVEPTMSCYPNPFTDNLMIQVSETDLPATLTVLDVQGKMIQILPILETKNELDLSRFGSGIYLIKVQTNSGDLQTQRVIKR